MTFQTVEQHVKCMARERLKSRLHSNMTNQISINGPPVSEAQELVKEAVVSGLKARKRRKLPPPVNPGVTSSGNPQSQVQAIILDSAIQTDIQVQEEEEVEDASVQVEVEATVEAFKLADHQPSYDSDDSAFLSEDEYLY